MKGGGRALARIRAEIPAAEADRAESALLEAGDGRWSVSEDALARRAWIVGIFANPAEARAAWERLLPLLPMRPSAPAETGRLAARDWAESYKAHFKPWHFGPLHWVPVWLRRSHARPRGARVVWLDPGMAFGTGNHETTRLCCRRLVEIARRPARRSVIDAGCGSGILALSAVRLGFGPVRGFDVDPESVRVSRSNASLNGLSGRVAFRTAGLAAGLRGPPADVVLANIQADVLGAHAGILVRAVRPGGALVLSGILSREADGVRAAFSREAPGAVIRSRTLGEWSDLLLLKV
jgi:ribosomal protein L11 methyltransferase